MPMKRLTFLLYLLIAGLSGLYATDSLSVQFKVIDCDGSPLANASLSVEGISGKTNEEGYFSTKIVKKDGVWATYNYEVYPTGYPYLTGQFKEEDLKEDIKKRLEKESSKQLPILSEFVPSPLVRTRINRLAAMMHDICPNAKADDDFMFCVFPIAYASMAVNKLKEKMANPQSGIVISKNLKGDLKFVLGDL